MKKTNLLFGAIGMVLIGGIIFLNSCNKSGDSNLGNTSRLELYLTDAPGNYKEVWIDIQKVMVNVGTDTSSNSKGWKEIPLLRPGLYNLLDFSNGADTIIAGADLPAGVVSQIRLVLGNNNHLVLKDNSEVPLTTPSSQQSGLKLNVHTELIAGIPYALVLDFDASRSIVETGEPGTYILKPVIRTFAKAAGGAIEGVVLPEQANANVLAINNTNTLGTIPDSTGYFKFWGINANNYQLIFAADATTGYNSDTLNNINVKVGEVTIVDTVVLKK